MKHPVKTEPVIARAHPGSNNLEDAIPTRPLPQDRGCIASLFADSRAIRPAHACFGGILFAMFGFVSSATGQVCYQFSDGQNGQPPTVVVTVSIANIPASLTGSGGSYGGSFTSYASNIAPGYNYSPEDVVTITSGQTTTVFNEFTISINYLAENNSTRLSIMGFQFPSTGATFAVNLGTVDNGDLLPDGLTAELPPEGVWAYGTVTLGTYANETNSNILAIGSACAAPCIPGLSGMVLMQDSDFVPQQQSNWCWAAATQMLAMNAGWQGFQPLSQSQCYIVNQVLGAGPDPANPQTPYCCSAENACNQTSTLDNGLSVIHFIALPAGRGIGGFLALSEQDIMQQISCKNRLVGFTIIENSTRISHAMIIYGYETIAGQTMFWIYDPEGEGQVCPSPPNSSNYMCQVTYSQLTTGIISDYGFNGFAYDVRPDVVHPPAGRR